MAIGLGLRSVYSKFCFAGKPFRKLPTAYRAGQVMFSYEARMA
jgi:hypothetical protein